jgi:hypothetical protein
LRLSDLPGKFQVEKGKCSGNFEWNFVPKFDNGKSTTVQDSRVIHIDEIDEEVEAISIEEKLDGHSLHKIRVFAFARTSV